MNNVFDEAGAGYALRVQWLRVGFILFLLHVGCEWAKRPNECAAVCRCISAVGKLLPTCAMEIGFANCKFSLC